MANSSVDQEVAEQFQEIAVLFGRAVGLSCVAATANASVEDHAIGKMDAAWRELANKVVEFAESD
jgi:hypothetical protein